MNAEEVKHLISVAVQAMDEYLELNAPSMAHSDFKDCEEFIYVAGDARRALKNY
jgi:hypothetical protein